MSARALGLVTVVLLTGCEPKEIKVAVTIVTSACDTGSDPFAGVQYLRVRVTGDGIATPLESVAATGAVSHTVNIPQIPSGKNRVVEVRGYDGDPGTGGKTLSMGKSLPFEVLDTIADPANSTIEVNVFLRKVNAFTRPSAANSPKDCLSMKVRRAGHTATLLQSGKVFIAGGYNYPIVGQPSKLALSDTEIFNPQTNSFESSREMAITNGVQKIAKAFHTATLLKNGQVLLWGGENYTGGVNNNESPSAIILVYDPGTDAAPVNDYGAVGPRTPPAIPRTRHKATADVNGMVLIVGGERRTTGIVPVTEVEWFDYTTDQYLLVDGATLPRQDPCVAPVKGGQFIAVAGGGDGTSLKTEVAFFRWDSSGKAYKQEALATPPRLADPGRRAPSCATLRDGADLLVMGGFSDLTAPTPIASSELVNTSSSVVAPGPTIGGNGALGRGSVCSVQLPDGSVMAIGGLTSDAASAPPHSDDSTVIITSDSKGGALGIGGPKLPVPRYEHTCTALLDGTVLVTGGVNEQNSVRDVLSDAWIYQPAPVD